MTTRSLLALAPLALLAARPPCPAQGLLYTLPGADTAVADTAGDADADGVPDFAIGDPLTGALHVYSGTTRAELWTRSGLPTQFEFATAGDVNGDGHDDLVVRGRGTSPRVVMLSGVSGLPLWVTPLAFGGEFLGAAIDSLEVLDDMNGDGAADLAVGWFDATGTTHSVSLLSGAQGVVLRQLLGTSGFGMRLASGGDLDGDGLRDLLIGDPSYNLNHGRVTAHSSRDGALLWIVDAPPGGGVPNSGLGGAFGNSLVGLDDVDQDGVADFAVTEPYALCGSGGGL